MLLLFKCNLCSNEIKKLFGPDDKRPGFLQCECGGVMEVQQPDFSTTSVEVVDNGQMIKKVELRKDAVMKAKEKGDRYIETMETRDKILRKDENNT